MKSLISISKKVQLTGLIALLICISNPATAAPIGLPDVPLFVSSVTEPPLVLLTMGRDHKLFYEAYNDASDLTGDGQLNIGYDPTIDYFGYFDSYKCYTYSSSNGRFNPASTTANKKCSGQWSGDWLNYITTSRMDALRKVLYGGFRSTDGTTTTVLERTHIPQDAHSWGKEYTSTTVDGYNISEYTPLSQPTAGKRHLFANTTLYNTTNPLLRVLTNAQYRVWEWLSIERPVAGDRCQHGGSGPQCTSGGATRTDYNVRVRVCQSGLLEDNCKLYPNGSYKPTGILHQFGENNKMMFGLLTGSYTKNLSGGVLRKRMGSINDEIDPNTGKWSSTVGIVKTIDRLREIGFSSSYEHTSNCGYIFNRPFNEGECRWWGNPIAEMMYEGLRYFAGKGVPTSAFNIASSGNDDATLGLPLPGWDNPYNLATGGAHECAIPLQLVISDINPSYDSNQLPGVHSSFGSFSGDLAGLNVRNIANNIITANEPDVLGQHFIGQVGNTYDGAPSPKNVTGLGDIRGLAPEEPSKQGSYYSASVAYHGLTTDINTIAPDSQNVITMAVAIASPLPRFEIPVGNPIGSSTITLVPFAKSVGPPGGGQFNINGAQGQFQPTNTIVDFYVQSIANTNAGNMDAGINGGRPQYIFRINYEDAEQGADHDMDAIVIYTISVNADGSVTVNLVSEYAAGSIIQHMGYVISGTDNNGNTADANTDDGIFLEVRDFDTAAGNDVDYFLDTPNIAGTALPLNATRTFTPAPAGGGSVATLLKDPLWYAAKWGGFVDENDNDLPDLRSEWAANCPSNVPIEDCDPDNYFLVTNAGNLPAQLEAAFVRITELVGVSASSVAINSTVLRTDSRLYQARFNTTDWSGEVSAFSLNLDATLDQEVWTASNMIPAHTVRNIFTRVTKSGTPTSIPFTNADADLNNAVGLGTPALGAIWVDYIRGNQANEQQNGGALRNRDTLLGDIVNSSPLAVGIANFGYDLLPTTEESTTYNAFLASKTSYFTSGSNTFSVIYVGANDGMLHAFKDTHDTNPSQAGQEVFAYVPSQLHSQLHHLTDPNYAHRFYVDATPHSSDAFIDGAWRTMLVGAMGNGARGIYALDITDPLGFTASDAMWEFDSTNDAELGHVLNAPVIARLNNGKWGVIFGNGYNSASQKAQLFILDAEDGSLIKRIDTGVGSGAAANGLGQPIVIDTNGDRVADTVYAGDLYGNLWKFNISGSNTNQWDVAYKQGSTPKPLYTAVDSSNNPQPITTRPSVATHPDGGFMVLFGTGKFLEVIDTNIPVNPQVQRFYGIRDNNTAVGTGVNDLQEQTILAEVDIDDIDGNLVTKARLVSDTTVNYTTKKGWYIDLVSPVNGAEGERVIANPLIRFGRIIFVTYIPKGGCEQGGSSTIMELDAISGARLENSVFDYNNDGVIDADDFADYAGGQIPGSGIYIPATLASPAVIGADDASMEYKLTSGISGEVTTTKEATGSIFVGRQSWRQLR